MAQWAKKDSSMSVCKQKGKKWLEWSQPGSLLVLLTSWKLQLIILIRMVFKLQEFIWKYNYRLGKMFKG